MRGSLEIAGQAQLRLVNGHARRDGAHGPSRPDEILPLEAYEVEIEPRGEVVDGGRLVVAPQFRGEPAHKVLACLFARFWLETRARGYTRIAAVAPRKVIGFYERLGLEVTVVGEPRWYWGDERYPILLAGTESVFSDVRGGDASH